VADPEIRVLADLAADPDPDNPEWVEITDRVAYGDGGRAVTVTVGRQDDLAEIRPTEIEFALRNHDGRFTPANAASPLFGRWEQGRRVMVVEHLDGADYPLGAGILSMPEQRVVDPRTSQPVTVTAVDWMGRLDGGAAPFVSTLAEYIRNNGSGRLVEYYPLSDPEHPMMSLITGRLAQPKIQRFPGEGGSDDWDLTRLIKPQAVDGPPGDDASYPAWSMIPSQTTPGLHSIYAEMRLPVEVEVDHVIAVSMWVRKAEVEQVEAVWSSGTPLWIPNVALLTDVLIPDNLNPSTMWVSWDGGDVVASRRLESDAWRLVTIRVDLTQSRLDLWVGDDLRAAGTGIPLSPVTVPWVEIGSYYAGSIAHVQVRVGDETTWTYDDHLAQHAAGYHGLHRQTVADRVRTLARWAGVPEADIAMPDECATPLLPARLAGQSPAAAIRAAGEAGQDWIITDGLGRITAVPRSRRYNQNPRMSIPWGWIQRGSMRMRPDQPVTEVVVTRAGGGSARRVDPAAARRHGVRSLRYELASDVAEDAGNLAGWALRAYAAPRTRSPGFVINMLSRSSTERAALLSLRVGDLIEITGMPEGTPADLPYQVINGIKHTIGPGRVRTIEFVTSPLLGPAPGEPPPCPMVGDLVGPDAVIAY